MNSGGQKIPTPPECALAAEMFDHFCSAGTMKQILTLHREICDTLNLKPNRLPDFYPKLKEKLASSWKAQALFKKFDARANHKVYSKGRACYENRVLLIGAGPCGLRAAIECQLLGAKVIVIEKRDRFSRNNVLHLWPFVIHDLRALGAKKFFGKFCAGAIDHISIRQLQCILMKVALLLGVEIHEGVSFEELLEPTATTLGWRARVDPLQHPVSQYEFDSLIGADGKRNTLQGFKRKEFRGKLAMAITANFINRHTEQEASVPEISGVAFIFNQKFFKELYQVTRIDLENIVYYKDDTHYFVMTAKKHSLLEKGVLLNDFADVTRLLSVENVDRSSLMKYAQEAARFSTNGRLPLKDFALNHYGEPDVALFDFTSMYAAENASIVYERLGRRLLCQLVGDSLLEPFWPTGSGCARGFLSALDAAWAVRSWGHAPYIHPLQVIAERESIYRLLAQTTPENLHRDFGAYTLDPGTRYPNLNRTAVTPHRVTSFYDSDEPLPLDASTSVRKRRREPEISEEALLSWVQYSEPGLRAAVSPGSLINLLRRYRPDLLPPDKKYRLVYHILQQEFGISPFSTNGSTQNTPDGKLRSYLLRVYHAFKGEVPHVYHNTDMFKQIKQSQQRENNRNTVDHAVSAYTNTAETEKSHSSHRKKRRSHKFQVSNDPAEYIRKKIEKLDLNNITQLARLIEGHDATFDRDQHAAKQKEIQEQIISLLDPDDSPDPKMVRDSLAHLLGVATKTKSRSKGSNQRLNNFFKDKAVNKMNVKPSRKLKGLAANTIKSPDFSDVFQDDSTNTDATIVESIKREKKKDLSRSPSYEKAARASSLEVSHARRMSEVAETHRKRFSTSPEITVRHGRSHSVGAPEMVLGAKRMAKLFEIKKRHTPSPESSVIRSKIVDNPEMVLRLQRMTDIIEGKRRDTPSPDRSKRSESIGNPEMALRRQRVVDLIEGTSKPRQSPEHNVQRRNSSDLPYRLQRVSDMMNKKSAEAKRPKSGGKRKAAREIMKQRFEKSLQMLAAEPRLDFASSADLENDYGLQQYRASAPQFDERVKKLEKKLQHYEEGRIIAGGSRTAGRGARVAMLAAELSNTTPGGAIPKSSKPKDLMRSVGKIDREDWNVKKIERKIMENRLGRPEPKVAEKVPKWDREQFLGRQRRIKEGDNNEEKWGEIDETLHKLDQKLRDSGRPDHGTKKVASLATKFVKKDEPKIPTPPSKEEFKRTWRGPTSAGMQCASCGKQVFAAEAVTADGLHLHRSCFRCAVCKTVLRPGNYTMERYGSRLVCLRHSGVTVPDSVASKVTRVDAFATPERISLEMSDGGAREIDEDEWTDRNFLASETSGAGGLSDEEDSSSDEYKNAEGGDQARDSPEPELHYPSLMQSLLYLSDDSFGYDDYSDEGEVSSGNESCSRMRAAREARRREVPAEARPPTYSSEMESEEESESSEDEVSSATEVSTDSEFAREECAPAALPPAILVTEATPPAPCATLAPLIPVVPPAVTQDYPLSRTRSAGGLATKRALELKRKYLLGEPSPPSVRKSDSTSQLDTKLEAFRCNISEFQKLLNPAPIQPASGNVTMQLNTQSNEPVLTTPSAPTQPELEQQVSTKDVSHDDMLLPHVDITAPKPIRTIGPSIGHKKVPMPDIISNLFTDAPLDLLDQRVSTFYDTELPNEEGDGNLEIDSDSLSEDDSSHKHKLSNQSVPRVEVHDEGGELIQLDSLTIANNVDDSKDDKITEVTNTTGLSGVCIDSESSESNKDVTTLALTETELSDWAAESAVLDECGFDEKDERKRNKNPRTLSEPKMIHETKNISAIASHICGKTSPTERIVFSNAPEHFEFADEGDQDPSIETPVTPRNEGYMELVDDYYGHYSPTNDRSMNFIERTFTETTIKPTITEIEEITVNNDNDEIKFIDDQDSKSDGVSKNESLKSTDVFSKLDNEPFSNSISNGNEKDMSTSKSEHLSNNNMIIKDDNSSLEIKTESVSITDISPPLEKDDLASNTNYCKSDSNSNKKSSLEDISPPLASEKSKSHNSLAYQKTQKPITFANPCSIRIYAPVICRSASETFGRLNKNGNVSARCNEWGVSCHLSTGSMSPTNVMTMSLGHEAADKVEVIKKERQEQTDLVRRLVLERLGSSTRAGRKSSRRQRLSPVCNAPPPVPPPPPSLSAPPPSPPPPPRPRPPHTPVLMSLPVVSSFSDPDLTQDRRRKGIMRSISNYFNRRLGPRHKCVSEPDLTTHDVRQAHKSTGALAPPVPPPPAGYTPPPPPLPVVSRPSTGTESGCSHDPVERDAMQLWFEARWARLVAQRRAREETRDEPAARRLARLQRRLTRPLSAEEQAAAVAEIVQVSAQRDAHQAMMAADRRRSAATNGAGD